MGETACAPESPLSGGTQGGASADPPRGATNTPPTASPASVLDLYEPITSDVILEVRRGKMKALEGLKIMSGIDKGLCTDRVKVDSMGIVEE